MKKLYYLTLLLFMIFCCSCGTAETNQDQEVNSSESNQVAIPESASEIVTDFFVDIKFDEETPVISMYDNSDDVNAALVAYTYIPLDASEVVDDCLIYIYTPDEFVKTSLQEQMHASESGEAKMPKKYMTYLKEKYLDAEGSSAGREIIDEAPYTLIKENIQLYVVDVLKEKYGEKLTEEKVEIEIPQSEDEREIIKHEVYEAEQVKVSMSLSKDAEKDYHLSVLISSEVKWKLAYSYIMYKAMMTAEGVKELNPVVIANSEEVMITSLGAMLADGTIVDASEWCVDHIGAEGYTAEEGEILSDELKNMLLDFLELK